MMEMDGKDTKTTNIYQVPPDLAAAILSFVDWEKVATTSTICKYIASSDSPFLVNSYSKSTVRKAINALKNTNEIEIYVKQSKRLKKDYIYCVTKKGKQMIKNYIEVQQTIDLANYDYDQVQKELLLKELEEYSLNEDMVNEQTTGVLESVECDSGIVALAEAETVNKENQTEIASNHTEFPFKEKNPIITENFENSFEIGHDHSNVIEKCVNDRVVGNIENQIDQTISVDENRELKQLERSILSDVKIAGREQTTEVPEFVECILASKTTVYFEGKYYTIPTDIQIIWIATNKESGETKLFQGWIVTEQSDDKIWVFLCEGENHSLSYNKRVKIDPRYLTAIDESHELVDELDANKTGNQYDEIIVEREAKKENHSKVVSYQNSLSSPITEYYLGSTKTVHDHERKLKEKNDQTISVEEKKELKEFRSTVLSRVEQEIATPEGNEQTTRVFEPVECVIISKSMVRIKDEFYSIPSDIEMTLIIGDEDRGKDFFFEGRIVTDLSNDQRWLFQYNGRNDLWPYNNRIKIDPIYLTKMVEPVKLTVEYTINQKDLTKVASYNTDFQFVEKNSIVTDNFMDYSKVNPNQTKTIEEHWNGTITRNLEDKNYQKVSEDKNYELKEIRGTVLSEVEKGLEVDKETPEEFGPVECIIISKYTVYFKGKFYSIPPIIKLIYLGDNQFGKDCEFSGYFIQGESNSDNWAFQYQGEVYRLPYNAQVKIDPSYLTKQS